MNVEKSCSFGLLCVSFVKVDQFRCVLLSLWVLSVGSVICGRVGRPQTS